MPDFPQGSHLLLFIWFLLTLSHSLSLLFFFLFVPHISTLSAKWVHCNTMRSIVTIGFSHCFMGPIKGANAFKSLKECNKAPADSKHPHIRGRTETWDGGPCSPSRPERLVSFASATEQSGHSWMWTERNGMVLFQSQVDGEIEKAPNGEGEEGKWRTHFYSSYADVAMVAGHLEIHHLGYDWDSFRRCCDLDCAPFRCGFTSTSDCSDWRTSCTTTWSCNLVVSRPSRPTVEDITKEKHSHSQQLLDWDFKSTADAPSPAVLHNVILEWLRVRWKYIHSILTKTSEIQLLQMTLPVSWQESQSQGGNRCDNLNKKRMYNKLFQIIRISEIALTVSWFTYRWFAT